MVPPAHHSQIPAEAALPERAATPTVLLEDQRVPLRLTATRGTLGLELYEEVELGPFSVAALAVTLPGLKFPLDLSGGVPKFRHRRGELEHLVLAAELDTLSRWAAPKTHGLLDGAARPPTLWTTLSGVGVGLVGTSQALAFELLWAPDGGDARLVVANARGIGLDVPAIAVALRAADTLLGGVMERQGRVLVFARVGEHVGRVLLPAVGARAPGARRVRFATASFTGARIEVGLDSGLPVYETSLEAARALELALLTREADADLARGEVEQARTGYLAALERAPRHPELVRTIAEIDAKVDGRTEAALGLLVESLPAQYAGLVGAELLARVGDIDGARRAVEQALRDERFAPLAALGWLHLAGLEPEARARFRALDRAVAQAPGLTAPRWARFDSRVARGDLTGALADAEHLEASERGARARHRACSDAGRRLLEAGYVREAGRVFERALRYVPDDAAATAALARALSLAGRSRRALVLLERAVALCEQSGESGADALLDLAKLLAEEARDLPQAISRVREVSGLPARVVEARYLEGIWRARLGDRAGAALAFGRLREAIELSPEPRDEWVAWLIEAAENALTVDGDPVQAERYLSSALRLRPRDEALAERYRKVARSAAELTKPDANR